MINEKCCPRAEKNPYTSEVNHSQNMNDPRVQTWLNSLSEQSRTRYIKQIEDFLAYSDESNEENIMKNIENYLEILHHHGMMTSTLFSILSILNSFSEYLGNLNFYEKNPLFIRILKQWQKKETIKQSLVIPK